MKQARLRSSILVMVGNNGPLFGNCRKMTSSPLPIDQTGGRQAPAVQFLPLVFQDAALPVNVCVGQVRAIGLRRADEPEQLKIQPPFLVHGPHERDVFGLRDGALLLFGHLRPQFARQDGRRYPAHAERVVVEGLQKGDARIGAKFQGFKEVVRRRLNQPFGFQELHGLGADNALVPHARVGVAAVAETLPIHPPKCG